MNENIFKNCYALTGSIATGKSTASRMLKDLGGHIIDTDLIARQVVEPGEPLLEKIIEKFGKEVLNDDGTLNREHMRDQIINDSKKRELLNSLTHPQINQKVLDYIIKYNKLNDNMPIIIDVPLLFEAGWNKLFSITILVYVPEKIQIERLMKRDSLDLETAKKTIKTQMDIESKKELATYIINNTESVDKTKEQVEKLFSKLKNNGSSK